jgi:hypothetical protein
MIWELNHSLSRLRIRLSRIGIIALVLSLTIFASGCLAPLARHSAALSAAIAPVVDQSANAYRSAVALHNLRVDYEAVVAYENKDNSYNPRNLPVLLSEKDIQARLSVLAALQVYSESLIEITKGTDSPELDAATKSAGNNLASLGNQLVPSIEKVMRISTSSTASPVLSSEVRNGITTGFNALGQVLVNRVVEKQLPGKIVEMDPHVQALCKVLADDTQTLQQIEERDYNRILDLEKQFILEDEQSGRFTNPQEHRAEIMKLPEIVRQQQEASEKLDVLRAAIDNLAQTHHALAAEAQQSSPTSLRDKLSVLAGVGSNLGKFYSSLPTN